MSDIIDIGLRITDLELKNSYQPISRVTVWYDDENAFTAGDDTGRTLEVDCPWATQAMANDILTQVKGYAYKPYSASDASLDPSFELGDAIEAGSLYSVIANVTLGSNGLSQVEAPGEEEINHEYPYLSSTQKQFNRTVKLGQYYYGTRITRKEGLVIEKTDGETVSAKAVLNADEFSFYAGSERVLFFDPATQTYKFTGELNVGDNFIVDKDGNVTINGDLALPNGSIQFSAFDKGTQDKINDASYDAANASSVVSNWTYQGTTMINGAMIQSDTIMASKLLGGLVKLLITDVSSPTGYTEIGSFSFANTTSGYGLSMTSDTGGIKIATSRGNVYIESFYGPHLQLGMGEGIPIPVCQFGGGPLCLDSNSFGTALPNPQTQNVAYGQVFFKLV